MGHRPEGREEVGAQQEDAEGGLGREAPHLNPTEEEVVPKVKGYTTKSGKRVRSHVRGGGRKAPKMTGKGLMGKVRAGSRKKKSYW